MHQTKCDISHNDIFIRSNENTSSLIQGNMDYYSYWNPPFAAIKGHVSLLNSKHNYKEKKKLLGMLLCSGSKTPKEDIHRPPVVDGRTLGLARGVCRDFYCKTLVALHITNLLTVFTLFHWSHSDSISLETKFVVKSSCYLHAQSKIHLAGTCSRSVILLRTFRHLCFHLTIYLLV